MMRVFSSLVRFISTYTLGFLLISTAVADESNKPKFSTPEEVGKWVTYYYKNPEPNYLVDALKEASNAGLLANADASPGMFGFLAGWFNQHQELADNLVAVQKELPSDVQDIVILGLYYSNSPNKDQLFKRLGLDLPSKIDGIEKMRSGKSVALADIPLEQGPWVLDALWGYFMVTGNDASVLRIATALPWADIKGDIPKLMVGNSASWSLASNAAQHDRVMQICEQAEKAATGDMKTQLIQVIARAEKERTKLKSSTESSKQ
jgi:hypothetical protein